LNEYHSPSDEAFIARQQHSTGAPAALPGSSTDAGLLLLLTEQADGCDVVLAEEGAAIARGGVVLVLDNNRRLDAEAERVVVATGLA